MLLIRILRRAGQMCEPAYLIQRVSALTALAMLLCALVCFLSVEEWNAVTYDTICLGRELVRTSAGILLIGIIAAVCIEDIHSDPT